MTESIQDPSSTGDSCCGSVSPATQAQPVALPVVVIGAGPVGLAAAAHLLERGLEPVVLESGDRVGAAIAQWAHIPFFSPWSFAVDAAAARLLDRTDWQAPAAKRLPTGGDLLEQYLIPLSRTEQLAPRIRTGAEVIAVTRQGIDKTRAIGREGRPYVVRVRHTDGVIEDLTARAVIDASGTWGRPNPLGAAGLPAIGEDTVSDYLVGPLPDVLGVDRARFAGRHTLVVGMGHSAANTLLNLVALRRQDPTTTITWAVRADSPARLYGSSNDELPARGALGTALRAAVNSGAVTLLTGVTITHLADTGTRVQVTGTISGSTGTLEFDSIAAATGFRPDLDLLREVRLDIDPGVEAPAQLAPLIDPNFHSCGTVEPHGAAMLAHPDENLYIVGMKSYGRAPTFLLMTGYEQVRSIAAAIAGDTEAAERVELVLPETGVCCTDDTITTALPTVDLIGFHTGTEHGRSAEKADSDLDPTPTSPAMATDSCCAPEPAAAGR